MLFEAFVKSAESDNAIFLLKGAMAIRGSGHFNGENMTTSQDINAKRGLESHLTQSTITCSKLTIETQEKGV